MKTIFSTVTSLLTLLVACGHDNASSTVKQVDAQETVSDGSADPEGSLHLGKILSISSEKTSNGTLTVSVTYQRECNESFEKLLQTRVGAISLANPHIGVGILVSSTGQLCKAAARNETKTFTLPDGNGVYTFETMTSLPVALGTSALTPARIQAVEALAPVDGEIEVRVTFSQQPCNEEFEGLLTGKVGPISLANPHVAVLALLKNKGVACAGATFPVTKSFKLPATTGIYSFAPVK